MPEITMNYQQFLTIPYLTGAGIVGLITIIAMWRIFKKLDAGGVNALIPIWNESRLGGLVAGVGMSISIFLLYMASVSLVVIAYVRSVTNPGQANKNLLFYSIVLGMIIYILNAVVRFKLAEGFGKNIVFRMCMVIPGLSTILMWVLGLGKSTYTEGGSSLEEIGITRDMIYGRSGIYGQENYNPSPYIVERKEPQQPQPELQANQVQQTQPYLEPISKQNEEFSNFEPIPELEEFKDFKEPEEIRDTKEEEEQEVIVEEQEKEETEQEQITWDQLKDGTKTEADLTVGNRPLYEGEKQKPVIKDYDMEKEITEAVNKVLFDNDLREAFIGFVHAWNDDKEGVKQRINSLNQNPEPKPQPEQRVYRQEKPNRPKNKPSYETEQRDSYRPEPEPEVKYDNPEESRYEIDWIRSKRNNSLESNWNKNEKPEPETKKESNLDRFAGYKPVFKENYIEPKREEKVRFGYGEETGINNKSGFLGVSSQSEKQEKPKKKKRIIDWNDQFWD